MSMVEAVNPPATPTIMPVDYIIAQKTEGALDVIPKSSCRANSILKMTWTAARAIIASMQKSFWACTLTFDLTESIWLQRSESGMSRKRLASGWMLDVGRYALIGCCWYHGFCLNPFGNKLRP
jgi:hypothetical protein